MTRSRSLRRQQSRAAAVQAKAPAEPAAPEPPVPHAALWLTAAFLIPNLGAVACGFVFDDLRLLVENDSMHIRSLGQLLHIWKSGYWPDHRELELYRPVAQTLWAVIWAAGGGTHPWVFHVAGLALGLATVLLLYCFLLVVRTPPRAAFIAGLLFALFPIHTDAVTSVVGSAETLAASCALGALLFYYRGRIVWALLLFAIAVLSKENAAAFAALPVVFPRVLPRANAQKRDLVVAGAGAALIIVGALAMHQILAGSSAIPPVDNPATLVDAGRRLLTALWVQCLYVYKTFAPVTLSADYSYRQIPLVMGLADWRAWAGLALAGSAIYAVFRHSELRPAVLTYAVLFSPTANVLFPIGTIMGERLAYAPILGLALLVAMPLARFRHWKTVLATVALLYAARTAVRNLDWLNAERFYTKLVETSPDSAKAHYSMGVLRASKGDDTGAIESYNLAIAIYPVYGEAYRSRGNSLARLGRRDEAVKNYQQALRFLPDDPAASFNLREILAGHPVNPPRARME